MIKLRVVPKSGFERLLEVPGAGYWTLRDGIIVITETPSWFNIVEMYKLEEGDYVTVEKSDD